MEPEENNEMPKKP